VGDQGGSKRKEVEKGRRGREGWEGGKEGGIEGGREGEKAQESERGMVG
jgi:hypothetical protein